MNGYDIHIMEIKEIVANLVKYDRRNRIKYIINYLDVLKLNYKVHTYHDGITNIEVVFEKNLKSETIILSAHFDISLKTKEGANDNASSVAVLLKLCSVCMNMDLKYNLRILFNDNEELLGGLNGHAHDREFVSKIIGSVGSFLYLKKYENIASIKYFIILELCGIGDAVFIAKKTGVIETSSYLNEMLFKSGQKAGIDSFYIDIPSTDMISLKTFGVCGTVIGAIPYYQAKNFMESKEKSIPGVWSNIHSNRDNIFAINSKALDMCCNFLISFLNRADIS